jgi:hypothetical protein
MKIFARRVENTKHLPLNFNPDWKFIKADPPGARSPGFNDSAWADVSKSLKRIADHATNVAEDVVYLREAQDIRHTGAKSGEKASP